MLASIPNFSKLFKVSFFDFVKVQFQAVGILIAILVWVLFSWFGHCGQSPIVSIIFGVLQAGLMAIVLLLSMAGVSRMIKADLLNEPPLSSKDARLFIRKHAIAIVISPFLMLACLAIVLLAEAGLSFLGFIPVIGPVLLGVLTIPAVIINVVLAIIAIVGTKMMPAIVAVEESRTLPTLKYAYQVCKEEPLKVAFYAGMLMIVGLGIFMLPLVAFLLGLLLTTIFHWSIFYAFINTIQLNWVYGLFLLITGISVLTMASLVAALPLTYFNGVYTYIYLSFKNRF